jgi:hypothetical protein
MEKVRKIVCFGGKKGCEKKSRTAEPWFVLGGGARGLGAVVFVGDYRNLGFGLVV